MNRISLICLFAFINALNLAAQNAVLKGKITEKENNLPMIQAKVVVDIAKGLATTSNVDGDYELKLNPGTYEVVFGYIGKVDRVETITIQENEVKVLNVSLSDKIYDALKQVVISSSKFEKKVSEETVTIEVLRSNILEQNNITRVDEGLNKVPGVTMTEGQANIRGGSGWSYGSGSRVMVLLDDIPLLTADASDVKWSFMPVENIEQIEVVKGAASSIYGTGALNGVINVRTGYAKSKPETRISTWGGFANTPSNSAESWWTTQPAYADTNPFLMFRRNQPYKYGANFIHKRKIGQVDFVIGGQYQQERTHLREEWSGEARITSKIRWKPKNIEGLSLGINTTFFRGRGATFFMWKGSDSATQAANGGDIYARTPFENTMTYYSSQRLTIDPFVNYADNKGNAFSWKSRFFNATNTNNTNQGSVPNVYYSEFQYNRFFDKIKLNLVAGAVINYGTARKPDGDSVSLFGEHNSTNLAAFFQLERKFIKDKLNVSFGGRYEYMFVKSLTYGVSLNSLDNTIFDAPSNFGQSWMNSAGKRPLMKLGFNYKLHTATYLRMSVGEGYRFPTMGELFVKTQIGPLAIYPNKKLRPEYGWYAELGIKQGYKIKDNWVGFFDLAGYINQYQNMMEFNIGQFGADLSKFLGLGFAAQNVGNTRIIGFDYSAGLSGKWGKMPVQLIMGYTYIVPVSLNWNDRLVLYNENGDRADSLGLNFLASKNSNVDYAATSSSDENVLKYRNRHTFTFDGQISPGKFDIGLSVQLRSWMENVDYAFVSPIFKVIGGTPFEAISAFRNQHQGMTTCLIDLRFGRRFLKDDRLNINFVVKNILNQTYEIRPAILGAPRNYAIQMGYKF